MGLKYAICSEIFQGWDLRKICAFAKPLGYDGIEIAHFHFFETVETVGAVQRAEMRRIIEGEGMVCSGLHWLMVSPKGLHITTRDAALRRKSWDYLARLVDFCGDLGGPVMVLGSPYQRSTIAGLTPEMTVAEAHERLAEGLTELGPLAAARNLTVLMEAVPSTEGNVCNRLADSAAIVRKVNHPNVQTMFDVHNTADETEPMTTLLERHYPIIRHVHVNEMDGRHPGTGNVDFAPIFNFLIGKKYPGWVSLEVFDFKAGAETIARDSINYLKKIEAGVG
ncbi:sugar phosphate isomerase/epimerase [Candidatus Sumerlaeota bacterium]|nr:sugar phosphate isomerase/epimerase [Candidatus Sumerlaeota bacterium]